MAFGKTNKDANNNNAKVVLELDWLALGVAVKYQLPLDNSPQSTLMWKRQQAFSTHRRTLMSERLIKTPIRYYLK